MSSHHVVKENQEGSLVILETDSIEFPVLESFLEWSPIIIAGRGAFKVLTSRGIKVDAVICSSEAMDELTDEISYQYPIDVIQLEKDDTTIDMSLDYLMKRKSDVVNVFTWLDLPEMFQIQPRYSDLKINIIIKNHSYYIPGKRRFEKWLPISAEIIVLAKVSGQYFDIVFPDHHREKIKVDHLHRIISHVEGKFQISSEDDFVLGEVIS